jgi:hypothetical protein
MGTLLANVALGRANELAARVDGNDPVNSVFVLVLCTGSETDDNLGDATTLAAAIALAVNESTATNYARITLSDTSIGATTVNNTSNTRSFDIADQTWSSLGGASNDTLTRLLIGYDSDSTGGTDSNIELVGIYDFSITTNGGDITATINASGLWTATRA